MSFFIKTKYFQTDLHLVTIIKSLITHSMSFYGFWLSITGQIMLKTIFFHIAIFYLSVIGETTTCVLMIMF